MGIESELVPTLAWVWAAPLIVHGAPIPRAVNVAIALSVAASETSEPRRWAATLDVFAALETNYGYADVAGGCPGVRHGTPCTRAQHARYCSPWMLLCALVPPGSTLEDEARIAIATFQKSRDYCPRYPFGRYVGVGCHSSRLADARAALIARELAR
jgi:hypothetical protein